MAQGGSPGKPGSRKISNSLVAVSSAAVMAVYAAGYARTRTAADRLEGQTESRRPHVPKPPEVAPPVQAQPSSAQSLPTPAQPAPARPAKAVVAVRSAEKTTTPEPSSAIGTAAIPESVPVPEPVAAPPAAPPPPPTPVWKDGTYTGWGTSRHGDIQASVVIEGGKISSATIAQCLTRYSCSVIDRLPPEVAERQSAEVDYISGATQSTDAFYYAVVEALSKAK